MTSSLKIGAISGLIAGIVAGIAYVLFSSIALNIGITRSQFVFGSLSLEMHLLKVFIFHSVWGVIFGVLFAVFYSVVPKKGYAKGLVFALILWLIAIVRPMSFMAAYAWSYVAGVVFISFFVLHIYGLVLGFLFKKELPLESIQFNLGNGVRAGIIAGSIGGASAAVTGFLGQWVLKLWAAVPGPFSWIVALSAIIVHFGLNAIWGGPQGMIYAMFYDKIPGKGISKGLMYGVLLFVIAVMYSNSTAFGPDYPPVNTIYAFVGLVQAIVYGIVLGALYKK